VRSTVPSRDLNTLGIMQLPEVPRALRPLTHPWVSLLSNVWFLVSLGALLFGLAANLIDALGVANTLSVISILVGLIGTTFSILQWRHQRGERIRLHADDVVTVSDRGEVYVSPSAPSGTSLKEMALADDLRIYLNRGRDLLGRIGRADQDFLSQPGASNPLVQEALDWSEAVQRKLDERAPELGVQFSEVKPMRGDAPRSAISLRHVVSFMRQRIDALAGIITVLR
jgi:hypothetical protein